MSIQTKSHDDILQLGVARPESVALAHDPAMRASGHLWIGEYKPSESEPIQVQALTSATSWIEVSWPEPSTVVGVQFYGDDRGSWARIRVDGEAVWQGNTNGSTEPFTEYIEISGLSDAPHVVRVEALGQAGTENGPIFVGVTAIGTGEVSPDNKIGGGSTVFMPIIQN